ncbi:MAG TPA: hypothetical protein DCW68_02630 [Rhodospirillaceae bacterium]|nr:MAG: hypothetical protein A2018_05605 [Alphaproteobacteria bacterium GWF2_58_20]HAU28990.1 hypothetical protein [Rhodospirillaceae bacterium]
MSTPQIRAPLAGPSLSPLPVLAHDHDAGQRIAVGAASAQSAPVNAGVVFLKSTRDCFYRIGENPVAANAEGSFPLSAGETHIVMITPGHRVAAIRDSLDGYLFISPAAEVS